MNYTFDEKDMLTAAEEWGCNCGPSALAFTLQVKLDAVRYAIPKFDDRRYTSPTMMQDGLAFFRQCYRSIQPAKFDPGKPVDVENLFHEQPALVRIQWCGPWTAPGANPRSAYRHTHWIAAWSEDGVSLIFDCNGGITGISAWIETIVPLLTKMYPRSTGEWFPTHILRLQHKPEELDPMLPKSTKLYQISEPDLAELERILPELLDKAVCVPDCPPRYLVKFRRVHQIMMNVRWDYGPPTNVQIISCD